DRAAATARRVDENACPLVAGRGISRDIDANVVPENLIAAVDLDLDAVAAGIAGGIDLEMDNAKVLDRTAAPGDQQAVGAGSGVGAIENDDRVYVREAGLRAAIDNDWHGDGRQPEGAWDAHLNGLYAGTGNVEMDGIVEAERAGVLGGNIRVTKIVAGV